MINTSILIKDFILFPKTLSYKGSRTLPHLNARKNLRELNTLFLKKQRTNQLCIWSKYHRFCVTFLHRSYQRISSGILNSLLSPDWEYRTSVYFNEWSSSNIESSWIQNRKLMKPPCSLDNFASKAPLRQAYSDSKSRG